MQCRWEIRAVFFISIFNLATTMQGKGDIPGIKLSPIVGAKLQIEPHNILIELDALVHVGNHHDDMIYFFEHSRLPGRCFYMTTMMQKQGSVAAGNGVRLITF